MSIQPGSMDPRMLKELLQLQMLNSFSLLSSGQASSADVDGAASDFSAMLQELLAMRSSGGTDGSQAGALQAQQSKAGVAGSSNSFFANPLFHKTSLYAQQQQGPVTEYEETIRETSYKYGVDPSLVKAVIDAESSFNPKAVSHAGAKGLMQLMDATGAGLGVTNPFDPEQNIAGGTKYLSNLINKYNGNTSVALAAYNAGSGRMDRLGIRTDEELMSKLHLLPKETQNYVSKVQRLQHEYQA